MSKLILKSFAAVVTSMSLTNKEGETYVKTRGDGSKAAYSLCILKFTDGPLAGQTITAQRSLVNAAGTVKDNVAVGDNVFATRVARLDSRDGKGPRDFFEVTTSLSASAADIEAAFGAMEYEGETVDSPNVEIPLAS